MEKSTVILTQESYEIIQSNQSQEQQELLQLKVFILQKLLFKNGLIIAQIKINQQKNTIQNVKVYIDIKLKYKHIPIIVKQQIQTKPQNLNNLNKYKYQVQNQSIETLIQECHLSFTQWNTNYIPFKDKINQQKLQIPYSYELNLDQDALTKKLTINFPFLLLLEDSLMFNPLICDQNSYIINIIQTQNIKQVQQFNKKENYQLLLFWKIKTTLQNKYQNSKFQFIIYPKHGNFAILKDNQLYFINQLHQITFLKNNYQSQFPEYNPIQNMIKQRECVKINLFEYTDSETILHQKSKYIDLEYSKHIALSNFMDQQKCADYCNKLKIEKLQNYDKNIQVFCKQYSYIYSAQCGHQIILDQDIYCSICQINIKDYGSIFIEESFYKYYVSMQEQIYEIGKYPPLFIDPLIIVEEKDKYGNIYYLAQLKDQEQNIIYTIKRSFLTLNHNIYLSEDLTHISNYDDRFNKLLQKCIEYEQQDDQKQEDNC